MIPWKTSNCSFIQDSQNHSAEADNKEEFKQQTNKTSRCYEIEKYYSSSLTGWERKWKMWERRDEIVTRCYKPDLPFSFIVLISHLLNMYIGLHMFRSEHSCMFMSRNHFSGLLNVTSDRYLLEKRFFYLIGALWFDKGSIIRITNKERLYSGPPVCFAGDMPPAEGVKNQCWRPAADLKLHLKGNTWDSV